MPWPLCPMSWPSRAVNWPLYETDTSRKHSSGQVECLCFMRDLRSRLWRAFRGNPCKSFSLCPCSSVLYSWKGDLSWPSKLWWNVGRNIFYQKILNQSTGLVCSWQHSPASGAFHSFIECDFIKANCTADATILVWCCSAQERCLAFPFSAKVQNHPCRPTLILQWPQVTKKRLTLTEATLGLFVLFSLFCFQEDLVFIRLLSLSVEASKPQFQYE